MSWHLTLRQVCLSACGSEACHDSFAVQLPGFQGLPTSLRHALDDDCCPSQEPPTRVAVASQNRLRRCRCGVAENA